MDIARILRGVRNASRVGELWECMRHGDGWPGLIAGYTGLTRLSYPREFRTPAGDVITLNDFYDLTTAWVIFYRGEYRVDPASRTIVDAGANIGTFSLLAARKAPRAQIVALEPFPATRARFEEHIRRNGLEGRVACRPWALARADGEGFLSTNTQISQSVGLMAGAPTGDAPGLAVETVTLATFLDREGFDRVDLLKMDIEGAEHEVFSTTFEDVLRRFGAIALEYHATAPGVKATLFRRLTDAGFGLIHDAPAPYGPDGGVAHFRQA